MRAGAGAGTTVTLGRRIPSSRVERVPEPELMDDEEQARAYSEAEFSEPHDRFVAGFGARFGRLPPSQVVDLGCGPADVTVRFALAQPACEVLGVDGSEPMLRLGRARVDAAGLAHRVRLERVRLPDPVRAGHAADAVISNSLLHHLHDPAVLWRTVAACARPGAAVYVMDLRRPPDRATLEALVERYASGEPEVLRRDFRASLAAAFEPAEVVVQLARAGLPELAVAAVGDRHLVVSGRLRPAPGTW